MMIAAAGPVPDEPMPPSARPWAAGHLLALAVASVLALLFALASYLSLLAPGQAHLDADTFRQLALLRDGFFTLALALPSIAALGHLLLPPALPDSRGQRLDQLAAGAHLVGAALLLAATATRPWPALLLLAAAGALVCIAGTLQAIGFLGRLRAPRPRHAPTTMFARLLGSTAVAELVLLPATLVALACLVTERLAHVALWRHAGTDPLLFEHWLRAALAPLAYLALVPCLGVVADQLRCRARALPIAAGALLLLGGVAGAARLLGGEGPAAVAVTSGFALLLLVPVTVAVGNLVAYGDVDGSPASWPALAFVLCLVELAATGLPLAMASPGPTLAATAFSAAHAQLLLAALAFAVAAALHGVWPAPTASPRGARLARLGCAIAFAGVELSSGAQLLAGRLGMPLTLEYPARLHGFALVAAAGWLLSVAGAAIIGANLVAAARAARR